MNTFPEEKGYIISHWCRVEAGFEGSTSGSAVTRSTSVLLPLNVIFVILDSPYGNVLVGQIFEFVESIGSMLISFSRVILPARGVNYDPTIFLDYP